MLSHKIQPKSERAILPAPRTGLGNGLLRMRERMLDRLIGGKAALLTGDEINTGPLQSGTDLAVEIKNMLGRMKGAVMNEEGTAVDYNALRDEPAYVAYRRGFLAALRDYDPRRLPSPAAARAFWINLYNALVMDAVIQLEVKTSVTAGKLGLLTFFRQAAYLIDGRRTSLEDMEYGILRGNRGNPYLPGVHFVAGDPRLVWALSLDPRIHFALNCGGRSCPPIRAYSAENLNQQLQMATRSFLNDSVGVHPEKKELILSQIFRWFAADFGGRAGIIRFLSANLPDDERRQWVQDHGLKGRFRFTPYDWSLNGLLTPAAGGSGRKL